LHRHLRCNRFNADCGDISNATTKGEQASAIILNDNTLIHRREQKNLSDGKVSASLLSADYERPPYFRRSFNDDLEDK
jgi:hypothetical protein